MLKMIKFAFIALLLHSTAYADNGTAGLLFSRPLYDYVPSVMRVGDMQYIWWCGGSTDGGAEHDVIYSRSVNAPQQIWSPIYTVLTPTPGTWDSLHTCDPSVIQGQFPYNGQTYAYAMYYTGTDSNVPVNVGGMSGVGVAFSNDMINWVKYPTPLLRGNVVGTYGIGEQSVISADGKSAVWMFAVEQNTTDPAQQQVGLYYLSNGLNPQRQFSVTKAGVTNNWLTETDFTNDYTNPNNPTIYMLTNRAGDGNGIDIYRINWSDLQNGQWTKIDSVTSVSTGNSYNAGGGFLRNQYGNNTPWLPTLQVYFGSGSSDANTWDLYWYQTHY